MTNSIHIDDLEDLARGAAFLGTGGGGDPYIGRLIAREAFREFGAPRIIAAEDVDDDALICSIAGFGAPTVQVEKLICGDEITHALAKLEQYLGRPIDALIPAEIGGSNSLVPLMLGARRNLPVIDADGMGRAFPELQMNSFSVHGIRATPLVITDEHLNCSIIEAGTDTEAEQMTRALAIQMGLRVFIACFPMSGRDMKKAAIYHTLTLARGIGASIREGRMKGDPVTSLINYLRGTTTYPHAHVLFDGKITDLDRSTSEGFSVGRCTLASLDGQPSTAEFVFQNENLIIRVDGIMRAVVPDLICVVDRETAEPIPTQALKYGQRVKIIGVSAPEKMRTAAALAAFGPKAFDIAEDFKPIEILAAP
ncbi:DUF917 domain-containing protein [Govanella unica]|uniref:DUF917 domain-containing protein n=1 Tax=Govanella unica TaxID=2975056 RepID=A0A9X3TZ87_9PROT|nr:DUF917 domain-containing protein [Govania unica]MDA5194122.1 DUF917 domain-containing protein [Govania unica]